MTHHPSERVSLSSGQGPRCSIGLGNCPLAPLSGARLGLACPGGPVSGHSDLGGHERHSPHGWAVAQPHPLRLCQGVLPGAAWAGPGRALLHKASTSQEQAEPGQDGEETGHLSGSPLLCLLLRDGDGGPPPGSWHPPVPGSNATSTPGPGGLLLGRGAQLRLQGDPGQ